MSLFVTCRCGQSFQAIAALAGKTVPCPRCKSALTIPRKPPVLDGIPVVCTCGQAFSAKTELAGKSLVCPMCRSPLTIPRSHSRSEVPVAAGLTLLPSTEALEEHSNDLLNETLGLGNFDERQVVTPERARNPLAYKRPAKPAAPKKKKKSDIFVPGRGKKSARRREANQPVQMIASVIAFVVFFVLAYMLTRNMGR